MKNILLLLFLGFFLLGLSSCTEEVSEDINAHVWVKKLELRRSCSDKSQNFFESFDCEDQKVCYKYEYQFENNNVFTLIESQEPFIESSMTSGTYTFSDSKKLILCDADQNCTEYQVEFYKKYMDWLFTVDGCEGEIQFTRK